jgi:hypothetical protein
MYNFNINFKTKKNLFDYGAARHGDIDFILSTLYPRL